MGALRFGKVGEEAGWVRVTGNETARTKGE